MKKVLFLMSLLLLMSLGTANVKAQVRIGGNTAPQGAAVLDLNVDNSATPTTNKGALALPRISLGALSGTGANLNGTAPINGMLVYNTNTTAPLVAGIYVWSGTAWVPVTTGSSSALTDTLSGGGLTRTGSLVGIKAEGVVGSMIANSTVSLNKLSTTLADSGRYLVSDGHGVIATPGNIGMDTTARTIIGLVSPPTVSFTKVVDATFNLKFRSGMAQRVNIAGLNQFDICTLTAAPGGMAVTVNAGFLTLYNWARVAIDVQATLRCYQPSI